MKASTSLRNKMLDTGSFKSVMTTAANEIRIYGGTVPLSVDDPIGGATLLCTIKGPAGASLALGAAAGGIIEKDAAAWTGVVVPGGGLATFYRHVLTADTGVADAPGTPRVQGSIGIAGADMNLTNTTLAGGATQTLDFYRVNLPTL